MKENSKRVLIVEDDKTVSNLLESLLKDCTLNKDVAVYIEKHDNAFDAMESCIKDQPDLMTLDLNLNVKNSITGYELPRILHNRHKLFFPIAIISGDSKNFVDPTGLDFNHYTMFRINKPFDVFYIKSLFKRILKI